MISGMAFLGMLLLGACADDTPDYAAPASAAVSTIEPVDVMWDTRSYEGEEAQTESVLETYTSADGRCVIEKKPSYYEVYLDYQDGDYAAAGRAYAEAILKIDVDYATVMEPYLYENINMAFPNLNGDYTPVEERIYALLQNLPEEYATELESFAQAISDGRKGMESDGKLSYEEALLASLVPDALREFSCNSLAVWGEKSESGQMMVSRTMEWPQGSEFQMCMAQAVIHFQMGEGKNSYTGIAVLGMLDMLTGLNDKGVFAGVLDAGSDDVYECEGKKCYTYELRYAMEHLGDARSVGEYMVSESESFTFAHNVLITDAKECVVAEDYVGSPEESNGAVLRDQHSTLADGLVWEHPDSLCAVNAFVTEGNYSRLERSGGNYVRFCKFHTWLGEKERLTFADVKGIVTRERTDHKTVFQKLYSENVFHIVTYDYATGHMEICFTGTEGIVDHPVFTRVETD